MARGRTADNPTEIPLAGWKDILYRVWDAIGTDHISLVAAGVAFYGLLAIFPAVTALMAIAGLVIEPAQVADQLELLATFVPQQAATIILDQAASVAGSQEASLGIAFIVSLGLAIFSASRGMASLMEGLNLAYDEYETRGLILRFALNLGLTVLLVLALLLGVISALVLPAIFNFLQLPAWLAGVLAVGRWIIMALLAITGLSLVYRFGPCRADARWTWITPGAVVACVLWLVASIGFSVYVANFGSYNQTFGSLAGVIILLMWLWLSAYIVLLGAELNGEMEAQTRKDSTTGPEQPMGLRGAVKADVLGKSVAASD
ncbi:YihY/virulence factor BrkB family protein [Roseibium salinum]|uniref:YihY/virulence factor BrkB family protein n=1 Tax=Roseibium salinum TaxID=1604349 RepID=A0ABT3R4S9_9HYPH|nr:YihY/virulence factor BrkB family protein [Roseibium sp. DSM 29163]MCX2724204.1 YihY/virulence factor BrkB family protein [Roseibium sp. DSM 29163]